MKKLLKIEKRRQLRKNRIRKKIKFLSQKFKKPRIVVFKSNKYTYGQLIDLNNKTLITVSSRKIKNELKNEKYTKTELAQKVGEILGENILKLGIKEIIFDKGEYKYHGRVKALAEGLRSKGLKF